MTRWLRVLFMTLAFAGVAVSAGYMPATAQNARAVALAGEWRGVYLGGGAPNEFDITLTQRGQQLTGTTTERNVFTGGAAQFLLATVVGSVNGDRMALTKTYDGTAGVSHSVEYEGRIQPGGRRIVGTWRIGATTGAFEMVR